MQISLSEEQSLLRESVARFVANEYAFDKRQALSAGTLGFSEAHWLMFAELGWLGLPLPEADGGLDMGPAEVALLMAEFGRGLVQTPYLATVLLGARLLAALGTPSQRGEILPAVIAGKYKLTLAHTEAGSRDPVGDVAATAAHTGSGYRLDGIKSWVPWGAAADTVVVSARLDGRLALFLLGASMPGLDWHHFISHDGGRASTLRLDGVRVGSDRLLGDPTVAEAVLAQVVDGAIAALCAEAGAAIAAVQEKTVTYLKTREQFGRPLSSLQALQHRLVDLYVMRELAQSAALDATLAAAEQDPIQRAIGVSAAKHRLGELGRAAGKEGVQLHGGIGMAWDYEIGHYLKRLVAIDLSFGDSRFHLDRYRRLALGGGAA